MVDRCRAAGHDCRELLDVTDEPGRQPRPARLASGARGLGTVDMFCARECSGLPLYAVGIAWGSGRLIESAAQRGGQRRDLGSPDLPRAARTIPRICVSANISIPSTRPRTPSSRTPRRSFSQQTADPVAARQLGLQELENLRQQQASSLAYFDCFWMFAALTFVLVLVVLFMKRSVAEKGAHHVVE